MLLNCGVSLNELDEVALAQKRLVCDQILADGPLVLITCSLASWDHISGRRPPVGCTGRERHSGPRISAANEVSYRRA